MKFLSLTFQMKATPVVLLVMLYRVAMHVVVESVGKILKCNHSNESYGAVLFKSTVCFSIFPNWN